MSEGKNIHNDELTESKKPSDVQLTQEELSKAAGGDVRTAGVDPVGFLTDRRNDTGAPAGQ